MNGINLIKEYIKNQQEIIIFCGAGVSSELDLPSWKTLAKEIITKIADDYGVDKIKAIIQPMELDVVSVLDALELVSERIYLRSVLDTLKQQLEINSTNFSLHEAIYELSQKIITTNYDSAFEIFTDRKIKTFTHQNDFDLANLSELDSFLFKIHGDIDKPDSCILFKKDYEQLYSKQISNYIIEMAKIFTNKTLLFIGFSLSDPYIANLFDKIGEAYKSYTNKHFIITTEETKFDRYKDYLLPIKINDYSEINAILKELASFKDANLQKGESQHLIPESANPINIRVYSPKPINKNIEFNSEVIASCFANFNLKLSEAFFNIEKLNLYEDFDYIFVFTQLIKGQLVIEDESLKFKLINLQYLNVLQGGQLKGVFLFIESQDDDDDLLFKDLNGITIPIVIIPISIKKLKEKLTTLLYKVFTKGDLEMLSNIYSIQNRSKLILEKIKKGGFQRNKQNAFISRFIDKKNLAKFVGRKTDQENIIRKILSMRYENKILSVKGSGGIGKTSIVSKIGIELAERGYFENGVYFVTCNPIQSFENFEFEISQCFNLTSSKFLKEQIADTVSFKDRIIILDNFETLLNIEDSSKILDLVSFICDFSIIVITTRQILDLEFEEIYELRNLTTDEGVELFKTIYRSPISDQQEKILRRDIVEKLLNNNPLAIKLIAKGLPASKDLFSLKEELQQSIFDKEDIDEIFERKEDYNIERSTSLYHSINYSYINLNSTEKLAFELLSLFPDGMHMENFKSFCKSSKDKENRIGDHEIKQLDDKSLLENANGFLKLQSIISRFSDYKFSQRPEPIRNDYYQTAFAFNSFFVNLLSSVSQLRPSIGLKILDLNTNNYLKSLEYLVNLEITSEKKISYISKISDIFRDTNQPNEFLDGIKGKDFNFDNEIEQVLSLIQEHVIYWTKDFDAPFNFVKKEYPFEKLKALELSKDLDEIAFHRASAIYRTEGYDLDMLVVFLDKSIVRYNPSDSLFKLGLLSEAYSLIPVDHTNKTYFDYEIEFANNTIDINEVKKYINILYKKESLELTQMTYVKSKLVNISNDEIKKLVISNPYTRGLIFLMRAKNENDARLKTELFLKAKQNLYHVKYHYVECILEYLRFLKMQKNQQEFQTNIAEAISISKKYFFRWLLYKLNSLEEKAENIPYNYDYFKLPIEQEQINLMIENHLDKNRNYFKSRSNKLKKNINVLNQDFS